MIIWWSKCLNSQWEPQLPLDGIASLWLTCIFNGIHARSALFMPNLIQQMWLRYLINMMSNSSFLSCEEFGTIPPKKRGGGGGCGKIQVRPTILEIIIIIYKSKKQTRGTIMLFQNPLKTLSFLIQNLTTIINCLLGFQNHRININCIF